MNDREFDAYLREALRQPGPAHVPDDVRADEIATAVSIVADELLWGEADITDDPTDDDNHDIAPPEHDLSVWDERRAGGPWDDDDDVAGDEADLDDDPLLASEPLDHDAGHHDLGRDLDFGVHDTSTRHGPLGHDQADVHDAHDHGTHHDDS